MASQVLFSPVNAFISGRRAAQDEQYANIRNELARLELQNAPQDMQRRNRMLDLQTQGTQQNVAAGQMKLDAEKARYASTELGRALQSGNPREFVLRNIPVLAQKLRETQGVDLSAIDDETAKQILTDMHSALAGQAGIAPEAPQVQLETFKGPGGALLQRDPRNNKLTQVMGREPSHLSSNRTVAEIEEDKYFRSLSPEGQEEFLRRKRGDPKPSGTLEKRIFEVNDNAFKSRSNVERYSNVADQMERVQPAAGLAGKWSEMFKELMGSEDAVTNLRKEWQTLRTAAAIQNLPPGVATDRDVQIALSAFLPETANPKTLASFLRGLAKLEAIKADYHEFEADYIAKKKTPLGLNKAWRERAGGEQQNTGQPVRVRSIQEAMALPAGTVFLTPDGRQKVR